MVRLPSDNYGAPHCVRSSWCQDTHPWDFDPSGGNLDIPFPDGYPETTAYSGASHFGYPLAVTHGPGFRLWEGVGSVANDCIRNMSTGGFVRPWCDPFIQAGFDSGTVLDVKGAKVTGVDFQIFDVPDPRPSCGITNVGSPYNFDFVHHPRPQNINLRVDEQHSRLSMVSMLAPSPDWFTGLESVELCVNGVWASQVISTQPFDSGVDSYSAQFHHTDSHTTGPEFTLGGVATVIACCNESSPSGTLISTFSGEANTPFSSGLADPLDGSTIPIYPVAIFQLTLPEPTCAKTCTAGSCADMNCAECAICLTPSPTTTAAGADATPPSPTPSAPTAGVVDPTVGDDNTVPDWGVALLVLAGVSFAAIVAIVIRGYQGSAPAKHDAPSVVEYQLP